MEYINLAVTIMLRWTIIGLVVLYICNTLSFLSGVLDANDCELNAGIVLACMAKSPKVIFSIWSKDVKTIMIQAIKWPKMVFIYAGILYDSYMEILR